MMANPKAKTNPQSRGPKTPHGTKANGALKHPPQPTRREAVPCTGGCGDLTFDPEGLCVGCRRNGGQAIAPREPADTDFRRAREDEPPVELDPIGNARHERLHPTTGIPLCSGKNNTCENAAAGGVCWGCQQEAARVAEASEPELPADKVKMARCEVPILRMEGGHFSDRLDGVLTHTQTRSLRDVTDGLRAKMATLASGRPVVSGLDAVKWLLESLARAG